MSDIQTDLSAFHIGGTAPPSETESQPAPLSILDAYSAGTGGAHDQPVAAGFPSFYQDLNSPTELLVDWYASGLKNNPTVPLALTAGGIGLAVGAKYGFNRIQSGGAQYLVSELSGISTGLVLSAASAIELITDIPKFGLAQDPWYRFKYGTAIGEDVIKTLGGAAMLFGPLRKAGLAMYAVGFLSKVVTEALLPGSDRGFNASSSYYPNPGSHDTYRPGESVPPWRQTIRP